MKNKKLIGIIVAALGLVLIIFGCLFLSSGNKIKAPTIDIKDFTINNEIVTKVGDSLLVSNGEKYGYYDMNGKKVLDVTYTFNWDNYIEAVDAKYGLYVVTLDGKNYGVVDSNGKEILANSYMAVKIVSKNCFLVKNTDSTWNVIDASGKKIVDTIYSSVTLVENIGAILSNNDKYNVIGRDGKMLSKKDYVYVVDYVGLGLSTPILIGQVVTDKKDLFLATNGNIKIIENVTNDYFINENYVYYSTDGTSFSSYDLKTGKIKNKVKVDFSINGMSMSVSDAGLVGYKSKDGKTNIKEQYQFSTSSYFTKYGVAVVGKNELQGVIDKKGNEILPCKYNKVIVFSEKLFAVRDSDEDSYYLIDDKMKKISDNVEFDNTVENALIVYNGDKCGIVDNYNKSIFETKHESCAVYADFSMVRDNDKWHIKK